MLCQDGIAKPIDGTDPLALPLRARWREAACPMTKMAMRRKRVARLQFEREENALSAAIT
jgi:hypothetical protein